MIKWILIGVAVLVLILVGLGSIGWVFLNRPIDETSASGQAYATNFKRTFKESCSAQALSSSADHDQLEDLCSCAAEAIYEQYGDQSPAKLMSLSSDPEEQQKVGEIVQECADQAGIE